jgi:hypothetical protein
VIPLVRVADASGNTQSPGPNHFRLSVPQPNGNFLGVEADGALNPKTRYETGGCQSVDVLWRDLKHLCEFIDPQCRRSLFDLFQYAHESLSNKRFAAFSTI